MKTAVLFSGGKDSCLALHLAKLEGYDVKYLLNVIPENEDSWMFHKPNLQLLGKQAELLDIELIVMGSKGEKEKELADLKKLIEKIKGKVEGIVVGGIASSYQGNRIKKICSQLSLKFIAPLWNFKSERVWKELLKRKFEVVLTKISCEGLDEKWLDKIIDKNRFMELKKLAFKYDFRLDFEGGEAESAVLWMPEFKKHIKIKYDIKKEGKYRAFLNIKKVE